MSKINLLSVNGYSPSTENGGIVPNHDMNRNMGVFHLNPDLSYFISERIFIHQFIDKIFVAHAMHVGYAIAHQFVSLGFVESVKSFVK